MKKNFIILLGLFAMLGSACTKSLDLAPISSLSNESFWQTSDQFDAFVSGVHSRFRSDVTSFQYLGELRSDIFGLDPRATASFTGEATQGVERAWLHTLTPDAPVVSTFGNFYININQLNLLISKLNTSTVVSPANKSYYLGIAYGMRAYYYFQLLRSWGNVIIQSEPVGTIDVSNLAKAASPEADVMKLIKSDIDQSVSSFGNVYTFRNTKSYWSKPATLMLKAEVYLWTANRDDGTADATTAKTALTDIQTNTSGLSLLADFAGVFSNKGNNEIIFASRNLLNEATLGFIGSYVPQTGLIANYYDSVQTRKFSVTADNYGGLLRIPVKIATYRKFDDRDIRKNISIQSAYTFAANRYTIAGCFLKKYQGEQNAGTRAYTNDYPVYRYADLLLLLAEAKVLLGESPQTEINLVRQRAFGSTYNAATLGYPNQNVDASPKEAILQERFLEFIGEGKRWYDLRRFGNNFVFAKTGLASGEAYKLLWPIDRNSLTNNRALVQNPGYPTF